MSCGKGGVGVLSEKGATVADAVRQQSPLFHLGGSLVLEVEQPAYVGVLDPAYAGLCRTNHTLQNAF